MKKKANKTMNIFYKAKKTNIVAKAVHVIIITINSVFCQL